MTVRFDAKRAAQVAGGLATIGLAVVAVSPTTWGDTLSEWLAIAGDYWPIVVAVIGGFILGAIAPRLLWERDQDSDLVVLDATDSEHLFQERLRAGSFVLLKVFGYTGEVVQTNMLRYEDRYRGEVELQMLHRNWLVEGKEEIEHNASPSARASRPWNKSAKIKSTALDAWDHQLNREIRYYSRDPMIRGVVLCGPRLEDREAFVTFLRWNQFPPEGGSPHKGAGLATIYIPGASAGQQSIISYLESQFDREWAKARTAEDLLAEEERMDTGANEPGERE